MSDHHSPAARGDDRVTLKLPASGAYLTVLRMATAGLASRLDFTLDDIEDIKMAVDEASALLLLHALDDAELTCRFHLRPGVLDVAVSVPTKDGALPSRDTFSWTVLTALATNVDTTTDAAHVVTITLSKQSAAAVDAAERSEVNA